MLVLAGLAGLGVVAFALANLAEILRALRL